MPRLHAGPVASAEEQGTGQDGSLGQSRPRVLPGLWFPLAVFAVWRVAHAVVLRASGGDLVTAAYHYDGERYLNILHDGYADPDLYMPDAAFFPLLPWIARPLHLLTGSDAWTVHLLMTVTAAAAFCAVWAVSKAWRNERIARRAVVIMALFPSSLFLWAFYSEGLFIALGAAAVWADRRGRRGWALAAMAGLGATRTVGALIPAVMVVVRVLRLRRVDLWAVLYALVGVSGLIVVLLTQWQATGDPLTFVSVQQDWGRGFSAPWTSVIQGFENLYPDDEVIMVPSLIARNFDLWSVAIVAFAIGYAALSKRDPWPAETALIGVALVVLAFCSGVLASMNRFVFATWIIYPVYASLYERLPRKVQLVVAPVVVIALVVVSVMFIERFGADRFVG